MTIYRLPENVQTIIFDIDSTLYTNDAYAAEQNDVQIRHYAGLTGIDAEEARRRVAGYRETWAATHGGEKLSLGNTFAALGIPIETSICWRETLLEPEAFLAPDQHLSETLQLLAAHCRLIAVTNNPVRPAQRTLDALGVSSFFPDIIGLDTCGVSKPHNKPFLLAARMTGAPPDNCLAVGDRYDIDIAMPLSLNMGGILVTGVEDVYKLPDILHIRK